ncbi:hypothetical protein D3C87_2048160 [compost metagenome]
MLRAVGLAIGEDEFQLRMFAAGGGDHLRRCIDSGDRGAMSGNCRSQITGAAAPIDNPFAWLRLQQFN